MLRTVHVRRHAPSVSPFSEQRLLFAHAPNRESGAEGGGMEGEGVQPVDVERNITHVQTEFRRQLFSVSGNALRPFIAQHKKDIEGLLDQEVGYAKQEDLEATIELTREVVRTQILNELQDLSPSIEALSKINLDTLTEESAATFVQEHKALVDCYFKEYADMSKMSIVLQLDGILKWEIDLLREREFDKSGVKWRLHGKEKFTQEMRILQGADFDIQHVPNAFIADNATIYVNLDAEDFQDPRYGRMNVERTISHEVAHKSVNDLGQHWKKIFLQKCVAKKKWGALQTAIHDAFEENDNTNEGNKSHDRILDEAIAITLTNEAHPFADPSTMPRAKQIAYGKQQKVAQALQEIVQSDDVLKMMMEDVRKKNAENRRGAPSVDQLMKSIEEKSKNTKLAKLFAEKPPRKLEINAAGKILRTENPETASPEELGKVMTEENEQRRIREQAMTASQVMDEINDLTKRVDILQETYLPTMKKAIQGAEDRADLEKIIEKNNELFIESKEDFRMVYRYLDILARWDSASLEEKNRIARQFDHNPYENLGSSPNRSSILEADRACAEERGKFLESLKKCISDAKKPIEATELACGMAETQNKKGDGKQSTGVMGWLERNVLQNAHGHVTWMTPLNIMKVFSIYKEAISEYYNSNQTSKVYDFAKNMNIYKKIEHTLNKQARSANNDESGKFFEYIKAEGYTFTQVFGEEGDGSRSGVLFENRGNFNKAKAVIEYAADNAWLYKLDRFDGSDVYGIDFEGIEGKKSFDELIERNTGAQSKMVQAGEAKVGNDPDVPLIMNTMIDELKKRNIFVVQGIMQKLQGKAKYAHSPTWMLTTLLLMMREHPELRVCFDKGFMDRVASSTMNQAAWSITLLKMHRTPLDTWAKSGNDNLFGNNMLTSTVLNIEKRFKQEGVEFDNDGDGFKKKCEAIAMILSGQTYDNGHGPGALKVSGKTAPRKPISIFETQFNDYRKDFASATTGKPIEPKKTDGDYFDPNPGSDVLLLGKLPTLSILSKESQGKFVNPDEARAFCAQVFARYDQLGKKGMLEAQENFRKEMEEKFTYWVKNNILGGNQSSIDAFCTDEDQEGNLISKSLRRTKIVDSIILDEIASRQKSGIKTQKQDENEAAKKKIAQMGAQAA